MSFKSARLQSGKGITEVKHFMGVTPAAVYQWENGTTRPRASLLPKLAEFYGCSIDELLTGNPVPNKTKASQ